MIFLLPAGILIIMGWLIKYKKMTWLISGYNTASKEKKNEYDIEKLSKYVGNFLFVLASIFLIMVLANFIFDNYLDEIVIIGFIILSIIILIGIIYINTGNRVKKDL